MIYVAETSWPGKDGERLHNLWADEPDEALPALYAIGGDPDAQRRTECNAWEAYAVTDDQVTALAAMGVQVVDHWAAPIWLAKREGLHDRVKAFEARRAGCA